MKTSKLVLCSISCCLWTVANIAEQPKVCRTTHVNRNPQVIDGRGDDTAWSKMEWDTGFTQNTPYTEFSWTEGMQDLFVIESHDVFLIKVNHWFSY